MVPAPNPRSDSGSFPQFTTQGPGPALLASLSSPVSSSVWEAIPPSGPVVMPAPLSSRSSEGEEAEFAGVALVLAVPLPGSGGKPRQVMGDEEPSCPGVTFLRTNFSPLPIFLLPGFRGWWRTQDLGSSGPGLFVVFCLLEKKKKIFPRFSF